MAKKYCTLLLNVNTKIQPVTLRRVDIAAKKYGISRYRLLQLLISDFLEQEEIADEQPYA